MTQSGQGNGGSGDDEHNEDTLPGSTVVPFPGASQPNVSEEGATAGADDKRKPRAAHPQGGKDKRKARGPVLPVIKLTAKQEAFCQHVLRGSSLTDAYKLAFDPPGCTDTSLHSMSSQMYHKPEVQQRITTLMTWKDRAEQRAAVRSADRWWQKIWAETEADDATPASRVSALREIGKALGIGASADAKDLTADEAAKDLEHRLEQAMTRAKALK